MSTQGTPATAPLVWRNRIVGHADINPVTLEPNVKNWRRHPAAQVDALSGVLSDVGFVQSVIVNRITGKLVDGHLRVAEAVRRGQPAVPVTYVELTEQEEAEVLATLDPLAALAEADTAALDALLRDVVTGDAAVQAMLAQLAAEEGITPPDNPSLEWEGMPQFHQEDREYFRTVYVHFDDNEAVGDFAERVGQTITDTTRSIHYPKLEWEKTVHLRYVSDG